MKILGVGTDIVENLRIKNLIKNKSFVKRIFTKAEIINSEKTNSKTNYLFLVYIASYRGVLPKWSIVLS